VWRRANSAGVVVNIMLDGIFVGLIIGGIMSLMLYVVACEKL
jgi:hypothetical protein